MITAGSLGVGCDGPDKQQALDEETGARSAMGAAETTSPSGERSWSWVRDQFRLSPDKIHLAALLVSSHPTPVRDAIAQYRRKIDEEPTPYVDAENDELKAEVRAAAARYLGGEANEIALTDSTTQGIALVYNGMQLQSDDEVVTTEHGYYATHESLRLATARSGANIREIRLYDQPQAASAEQIVDRLRSSITPNTRALALTWVHSSTGVKLPLPEIGEAVAEINADRDEEDRVFLCVDGVHGFGVEDVTVNELGCHFFMAGCHKWLFGPRGTGIVWGHSDAWAQLRPTIPSFMDSESWQAWAQDRAPNGPTTAARMSPGGFKPFEHQWAMADAFEFHQEIGKDAVAERTHTLAQQLKDGLAQRDGVTLYTPRDADLSAGIVCFDIDGRSADAVVDDLREQDIVATTTPYAESHPRLTPSIYNTPEEVDTALQALRGLA